MQDFERDDLPTFVKRYHAMLKSATKRGPAWPDIKATAAAVEVKPLRMEHLLDA